MKYSLGELPQWEAKNLVMTKSWGGGTRWGPGSKTVSARRVDGCRRPEIWSWPNRERGGGL